MTSPVLVPPFWRNPLIWLDAGGRCGTQSSKEDRLSGPRHTTPEETDRRYRHEPQASVFRPEGNVSEICRRERLLYALFHSRSYSQRSVFRILGLVCSENLRSFGQRAVSFGHEMAGNDKDLPTQYTIWRLLIDLAEGGEGKKGQLTLWLVKF